jgi:hypothetical protein
MANASVKALVKSNSARLKVLQQLILATNAIYLVVRCGVLYASFTSTDAALWATFAIMHLLPYIFISSAAKVTYSATGVLVDGGEDIGRPGVFEYAHDMLYLTALAHVGSVFTPYAALLLAVIPMFVVYTAVKYFCDGSGTKDDDAGVDFGVPMDDALGISRKERRRHDRTSKMG